MHLVALTDGEAGHHEAQMWLCVGVYRCDSITKV